MTGPSYSPDSWFWVVGGDETRVYSSAAGRFVQPGNAAYQAFLAAGGIATRIASADDLGDVLADAGVRPEDATLLDRFKDRQSVNISVKTLAKVLFVFANEIRVLKGQQALTAQQFRGWLKEQM